jgi:hypothetical protein
MANTTNYNWETPDDTDLVKDGALAIRTLGSSIDTTTKALNPSTTLGDIEYRSATANTNTRLGVGTTGQVLTVAGGVPSWASPAGGGKLLQLVQGTYSTEVAVSGTTYADSGLSLSITPTLSTSKILVMINQTLRSTKSSAATGASMRILRGATSIYDPAGDKFQIHFMENGGSGQALDDIKSLVYLDSPATTSSTTYKTQICGQSGSDTARAQANSAISVITLMEIGA